MEKEDFKVLRFRRGFKIECDACHNKFMELIHLKCGDLTILKMCCGCFKELKKEVQNVEKINGDSEVDSGTDPRNL